jgi:hypothetical protein
VSWSNGETGGAVPSAVRRVCRSTSTTSSAGDSDLISRSSSRTCERFVVAATTGNGRGERSVRSRGSGEFLHSVGSTHASAAFLFAKDFRATNFRYLSHSPPCRGERNAALAAGAGVTAQKTRGSGRYGATVMVLHRHNSCMYNCCGVNDSRDVPATELRANLAAFLDEARSGVEFRITRGSRVAARLVPPDVEERSVTAREDHQ